MKRFTILLIFVLFCVSHLSAENYAVLITGDTPSIYNGDPPDSLIYSMFWNDTFLMWETLFLFGWKDENIFVLYGDGEDWVDPLLNPNPRYHASQYNITPWNISSITDDSAYVNDVEEVFEMLADTMTTEDFLFVWTSDHGRIAANGDSILCLMGGDSIPDYDFAALMDEAPYDQRVIIMSQCHSGVFLDDLENDSTVFISSCKATESATEADNNYPDAADSLENDYYAVGDYYQHSEFNYHILNALRLETIAEFNPCTDPDADNDGLTSLPEMYNWEIYKNSLIELISLEPPYDTTWFENAQYSDLGNIGDEIFLNIPPYAPENLNYTLDANNHPVLEWDLNTEYDIEKYLIIRQFGDLYSFFPEVCIDTLDHPVHTYTDYEVTYSPIPQSGACYRVKAMDTAGRVSGYSNHVNIRTYVPISLKDSLHTAAVEQLPSILQCTPNPFNQHSLVSFTIGEAGQVNLSVYDITGREVANLVEGFMSAGRHEAIFDGSGLASGVYFARIQAGDYSKTARLFLIK